jgi:acetyl-CoA carboxylase carboxyltransferase component
VGNRFLNIAGVPYAKAMAVHVAVEIEGAPRFRHAPDILPCVQLEQKRAAARLGGGQKRIDAQHKPRASSPRVSGWNCCWTKARLKSGTCSSSTAAPTSACRTRRFPGDGVVTGYGMINGRLVFVFSQDFTVFGGALSRHTPRRSARSWTRR